MERRPKESTTIKRADLLLNHHITRRDSPRMFAIHGAALDVEFPPFSNGYFLLAFRHYHSTQLHIQRDAIPEKSVYRRLFSIMPSAAEKRKSSAGIASIGSNVLLAVLAVLLFVVQLINGQQNGPQQTCPAVNEISPCVCQVKKNGLDILCEATDYVHITRAMTALKPKSPIIFYLKLRHNSLPKLQGFIFLALDIRHLTIHNSSLAVIEETSLSSLGEFHI